MGWVYCPLRNGRNFSFFSFPRFAYLLLPGGKDFHVFKRHVGEEKDSKFSNRAVGFMDRDGGWRTKDGKLSTRGLQGGLMVIVFMQELTSISILPVL